MTAARLPAFALILLSAGCASLKAPLGTPSSVTPDDGVFSVALARYAQGLLADADAAHEPSPMALDAYREAHRLDPDAATPLARCTLGLLQTGRVDQAFALLDTHVKRHPRDADAWTALGHVAEIAGKHRQAARAFARAVVLRGGPGADGEPAIAEVRNWFLAAADGRAIRKLRLLVGATNTPSSLTQVPLQWARHFILKENTPRRALPLIGILIDWSGSAEEKAAAQTFYGDALFRAGETNAAIRSYWRALETVPTHLPAVRRISASYGWRDDTNGVARLTRRIGSASAPLASALVASAAWTLFEQPAKAAAALLAGRNATLKRGDFPPFPFDLELGALLDDLDRDLQAAEVFRDALATHTNAHPIMNHLAYMWAVNNENLPEAQGWAERALAHEPRNHAYIDTLGWVHFRQGRFHEALTQLLLAARLAPRDDGVIFDHIGDTLQALGRLEEAIAFWRRALALTPGDSGLKRKVERATDDLRKSGH